MVAAPRCRAVHFAQQSVQGSAPCVKRSSHGDIVDLCRTLWHRQCVPNLSSCSLPHTLSLPSPQWCRIVFVDLAPQVGVWRAVTLRALSSGTSSVCLSCTPAAFRIRASWVPGKKNLGRGWSITYCTGSRRLIRCSRRLVPCSRRLVPCCRRALQPCSGSRRLVPCSRRLDPHSRRLGSTKAGYKSGVPAKDVSFERTSASTNGCRLGRNSIVETESPPQPHTEWQDLGGLASRVHQSSQQQ